MIPWALSWSLQALCAPVATAPTELEVEVVGPLAELTLRRQFHNDATLPIDTELWFALPAGGTIDSLVVTVGSRTLQSQVVPRQQAEERYVEAANRGQVATLLEKRDLDTAVQRISNVMPGEDLSVEIHLVAPVERSQGVWQLVIPLTVAPRLQDPGGEGPSYRIPTGPENTMPLQDRLDGHLRIETGTPIRWIESPSHAARTRIDGGTAQLWLDRAPANRDLVVRWSTSVPETSMSLLVGNGHGLLLLEPPAPWARMQPPAADVVVVVDASDTMGGARWPRCKEAVQELLASLREQDTFTLLVFADTVGGLAVRAPATVAKTSEALFALDDVPIGGSTNLALAMRFAMGVPTPAGRSRTVVLISDGGTDQDVVPLLVPGTTLHTVGLGASTNRGLLSALANAGHGVFVSVAPGQDMQQALTPVIAGLQGPVLTDATVEFPSDDGPVPQPLPPLYADRLVSVSARGLDCSQPAVVRGLYVGRPFEQRIEPTCTDRARPLEVLWALSQIAELDREGDASGATALAVEYRLLTSHTSLLGLDADVHNPNGAALATTTPTALPKDLLKPIATGRLYASELQRIPGTEGDVLSVIQALPGVAAGGNPSMGGGSSDENTYMLDGANITDPVTGTFSLHYNYDLDGRPQLPGPLPALPSPLPSLPAGTGPSNQLVPHLALEGATAAPSSPDLFASGGLSGPVIHDRVWFDALVDARTLALVGVSSQHTHLVGHFLMEPSSRLALGLSASDERGALRLLAPDPHGDPAVGGYGQSQVEGHGQYSTPSTDLELAAARVWTRLGEEDRDDLGATTSLRWHPTSHDLGLGAQIARRTWQTPALSPTSTLVGAYLQETWSPAGALSLSLGGGLRLDVLVPEHPSDALVLYPSPRVLGTWLYHRYRLRTRVSAGFVRSRDLDRRLPFVLVPEGAPLLPVIDTLSLQLEQEIAKDLWVSAAGALVQERSLFAPAPALDLLPAGPLPLLSRGWPEVSLGVRKQYTHLWSFDARWTWTDAPDGTETGETLLTDTQAPFVPGLLYPFRRHHLEGGISWALPTQPFEVTFGSRLRWESGIAQSDWWLEPLWTGEAWVRQELPVRDQDLALQLTVALTENDPTASRLPLQTELLLPGAPSVGEMPGWWVSARVSYGF